MEDRMVLQIHSSVSQKHDLLEKLEFSSNMRMNNGLMLVK